MFPPDVGSVPVGNKCIAEKFTEEEYVFQFVRVLESFDDGE